MGVIARVVNLILFPEIHFKTKQMLMYQDNKLIISQKILKIK